MLESSRQLFVESKRRIGKRWEEIFFSKLQEKFGDQAFAHLAKEVFFIENAEPNYIGDVSNRDKLRTESGVVFGNHPHGAIDCGVVLEALKDECGNIRPDFKMLVHETNYLTWKKYLGDHFFPAYRDARSVKVFEQVTKFVKDGGLFLIFPENQKNRLKGQPMQFETGLSYLLAELGDDQMVYTFSINPKDLRGSTKLEMTRIAHRGSMAIEALIGKTGVIPRPGHKKFFRVGERFSRCGEWKNIMFAAGKNRFDRSQALKDFFKSIHQSNL